MTAIAGSAVGVFIYQMSQGEKKPNLDASGFDLSQTEQPKPAAAVPGSPDPPAQSSLMAVQTGLPGIQFGARAGASPAGALPQDQTAQVETDFRRLCRTYEDKVRNFGADLTRRSPVLQNYGKEWMSYPDLKKLNDDFMRDHDPVAFLRGLAHSQNFGVMMRKYAGEPDVQTFAKQAFKEAPADLTSSAMNFANTDNAVKGMVDNIVASVGLPPGLTAVSAPGKLDTGKIVDSVLKNSPQMQQAMQAAPDAQKPVQAAMPNQ